MSVFSFGNRKLPKNTAIFNMSPAFDCESDRLNLCSVSAICYAKKAERMYKAVLLYRQRQKIFWLGCTPDEFVEAFIEAKKKKAIKYLRLNESGDFITQVCLEKAVAVSNLLYNDHGIKTYCYTARSDLDFTVRGRLVVNGSGFMVDNNFMVQEDNSKLVTPLCPADCKICSMCTKSLGLTINVKKH